MKLLLRVKAFLATPKKTDMDIGQVTTDEFSRIEGKLPNYLRIEATLTEIGGGGWKGLAFKQQVLQGTGLGYRSYSINPKESAKAFNRIREVLAATSDKRRILKSVKANRLIIAF